jgi:hypothetical protein
MGVWGLGIFDDDLTLDVRGTFEDALAEGLSVQQATGLVLQDYRDAMDDGDEGPTIWLALVTVQLEHGDLPSDVRPTALTAIDRRYSRWADASPADVEARKQVLEALRARLVT